MLGQPSNSNSSSRIDVSCSQDQATNREVELEEKAGTLEALVVLLREDLQVQDVAGLPTRAFHPI